MKLCYGALVLVPYDNWHLPRSETITTSPPIFATTSTTATNNSPRTKPRFIVKNVHTQS